MAEYVYGIVDSDHPERRLVRSPCKEDLVWNVACGDKLGIFVGNVPFPVGEIRPEYLYHHQAVLAELMTTFAVLPVRYGTVVEKIALLQQSIRGRQEQLQANLRQVAGRVEMRVKVLRKTISEPETADPDGGGGEARAGGSPGAARAGADETKIGTRYLLARLQAEQRAQKRRAAAEALARPVHAAFCRRAAASKVRFALTERLLLDAVYLVAREDEPAFQALIVEQRRQNEAMIIAGSGPWPPYHFVASGEEERHWL